MPSRAGDIAATRRGLKRDARQTVLRAGNSSLKKIGFRSHPRCTLTAQ
jgi:hypothetical protein